MKSPSTIKPRKRENDPAEGDAAAVDAIADERAAEIDRLRDEWITLLRWLSAPGFDDTLKRCRRFTKLRRTMLRRYDTEQEVRDKLGAEGLSKLRSEIVRELRLEFRRRTPKERELRKQFDWEVTSRRRRRPADHEYRDVYNDFVRTVVEEELRASERSVVHLVNDSVAWMAFQAAILRLPPRRRVVIERAVASMSRALLTPAAIERARCKRDELAEKYEALTLAERVHFNGTPRDAERTVGLQLPPQFRAPRAIPPYALRGQVLDFHALELERSTIGEAQWSAAGIFSECDETMLGAILGREERSDALVFPYFRPGKEDAELLRIKRMGGGRGYSGRENTPTGIYFTPEMLVDQGAPLKDRGRTLLWVEGEKKALALARMGYAVVGLPGVWTAHDVPHKRATKEFRLHEWIRSHVAVDDREHIVVFDPDIQTNTQVQKAQKRLVGMIWAAGASMVRAVQWPSNVEPGIGGIDDYASYSGDSAAHELIARANEVLAGSVILPASVIADPSIRAATKMTYGALFAAADPSGTVTGLSMDKLGDITGRSASAVSDSVSALEEAGYLTRTRGKRELAHAGWRGEPDTYDLTRFAAHSRAPCVQLRGVRRRSHEQTLVLAVLPKDGTPIRTQELANLTGTQSRALRYVVRELALAGAICRRHGRVARTTDPCARREVARSSG